VSSKKKDLKIKECSSDQCVIPMKAEIDWKKEEEMWKQDDIEYEKFYRMKKHTERREKERKKKKKKDLKVKKKKK